MRITFSLRKMLPPDCWKTSAYFCATRRKSTMPVCGTNIPRIPAACGSYSRICSAESMVSGFRPFCSSNNDLAAEFIRDVMALAEFDQHIVSPGAVQGFEAARLVVKARVDNTAVVTRLVTTNAVFFFQDGDF